MTETRQLAHVALVPEHGNPVNPGLTAETARRLIAGLAIPWGPYGRTSAGRLRAAPGSVRLPTDLGRIKLFGGGHDRETPVGHAVGATDGPDGLRLTFSIAPTPAGDLALVEAASRARDAFSVELDEIELAGDEIVAAFLSGVALVPVPAWSDARIESVAAAARTPEVSAMPPDDTTQPDPDVDPDAAVDPDEDDEDDTVETETETEAETRTRVRRRDQGPDVQAAAPRGLAGTATRTRRRRQLSTLYAAMAARATDQTLGPDLTAALADLTHTANAWVQPTQYEDQLWSGVAYQRQIVPLFTQRPLTSYKISGWRWKVKPEVDDYAGDKAEVPTNPAVTEEAGTTAKRLAGAHDIDRKFRDFGDAGFFQSYYEAMSESYALQSDDRAAAWLVANATASAAPAADLITVITTLAFEVARSGRGSATFALTSEADWLALILGTTSEQKPAWLDLLPIPVSAIKPSWHVPTGTAIVGAKPAISWYERAGSPIRVETVDLAHGGIDGGVFGYYAELLNDAKGLLKGSVAVVPPVARSGGQSESSGRKG